MRPIDNLRILLEGESPSWIPFSLDVGAMPGLSAPLLQHFRQRTGVADPAEFFGADTRGYSLRARFGGEDPRRLHPALPPEAVFDEWGIAHVKASTEGAADHMHAPLAAAATVAEIEALPTPALEPPQQVSQIATFHAAGLPVLGYAGSIYEWSWWLRGMEQFLTDLATQPALAEAVIRKVEEHTTRLALASAKLGIDLLCFYDDAGTQRGMQISPALWRKFIKPAWIRVLDIVRGTYPNVRFFLHSCGKIDSIIPDIVDLGFDVLHPIQPECMDFATVYRRFGQDIVLCATVSAQKTLPFGTADDVRREIRRLVDIVAVDRRCIIMPSNVFQPETPWENLLAFVEEAKAAGSVRTRSRRAAGR